MWKPNVSYSCVIYSGHEVPGSWEPAIGQPRNLSSGAPGLLSGVPIPGVRFWVLRSLWPDYWVPTINQKIFETDSSFQVKQRKTWEKFNFCFLRVFSSFTKILILVGGLGNRLSFKKFRQFLIFPNFLRSSVLGRLAAREVTRYTMFIRNNRTSFHLW